MTGTRRLDGMTAVTIKGLWANKSRFGLSGLAVVISVAFLTAMLLLTTALAGTASDDIAAANAGVDAVVVGQELGEGFGGPGAGSAIRADVDPTTVDTLLGIDGVDAAAGVRSGTAQLLGADGSLLSTGVATSVGETWVEDPELASFVLDEGLAPVDGIVIDRFTASETGLAVGDQVEVITETGIAAVTIDGIATYGPADNAPDASTILVPADSTLLGTGGFDRVVVDTTLDATALQERLPGGEATEVLAGSSYVTDLQDEVDSRTSFRTTFLLAFAGIALVAGTTIIYNTFVIAVAQRTRELALLRSIGASRAQVLGAVMGEAAVIGVAASAVGALAGVGAAYGLLALFEAIGLSILAGSLAVSTSSLVIGFAVGVVVTLVSAFAPARKAAETPPVAALRDAAVDPSGVSRLRNGLAVALLVSGSVVAVAGAVTGGWEAAVGGVLVAFVGVIVGGPLISGLTARLGAPPLERFGHAVGRLAATNAARNPRRSASTALALTLGVALIAFFTVVASSLSGTAASDTGAALRADQVVTPLTASSGPALPTALPGTVADTIPAADGIEAIVPMATATIIVDGDSAIAAGSDTATIDQVYDLSVVAGSLDDVGGTSIAVQADAADGRDVGDELTLTFPGSGEATVTVAAIYDADLPGQLPARYLFDDTTFEQLAPGSGDALILVSTDGSPEAAAVLRDSVEAAGGALVQSADDYVDSLGSAVDTFRNFVYALLGAAVIIALVGIANTTVMAIGERTKEIGMLRAVGMTATQVRRMVRNEALLLSIQGSLVGLALGIGGAYATFSALGDGEIALALPVTSLALIGIAAAASGVAAAAWPAWRASRMAPLDAIAS